MSPELTPEQREAIAECLYTGRKIEAIKRLRELSGLELKDSKDIIDRLEAELRAQHPERFKKPAAKGCTSVVALLLVVGGLLCLLFLR
jgi:ribosomal protein L7/L12